VASCGGCKASFRNSNLQLLIDRRLHGSSRKISNLINLMAARQARFFWYWQTSDVRVGREYLAPSSSARCFDPLGGNRYLRL